MSIQNLLEKDTDRRQFLKICGKSIALTATAFGLESLISCAPTLKETRQDVAAIKWDCNPILPIPSVGCYVGTNYEFSWVGSATFIFNGFKKTYGITPTFFGLGL